MDSNFQQYHSQPVRMKQTYGRRARNTTALLVYHDSSDEVVPEADVQLVEKKIPRKALGDKSNRTAVSNQSFISALPLKKPRPSRALTVTLLEKPVEPFEQESFVQEKGHTKKRTRTDKPKIPLKNDFLVPPTTPPRNHHQARREMAKLVEEAQSRHEQFQEHQHLFPSEDSNGNGDDQVYVLGEPERAITPPSRLPDIQNPFGGALPLASSTPLSNRRKSNDLTAMEQGSPPSVIAGTNSFHGPMRLSATPFELGGFGRAKVLERPKEEDCDELIGSFSLMSVEGANKKKRKPGRKVVRLQGGTRLHCGDEEDELLI